MVTLNTRIIDRSKTTYENIEFKYLVDVPVATASLDQPKNAAAAKRFSFLVFNHRGKIYRRNGLSGTWVELKNDEEYSSVRERLPTRNRGQASPVLHNYFESSS